MMTDQPDTPGPTEAVPDTIDADLGNYDESGHGAAAPGQERDSSPEAPRQTQDDRAAQAGGSLLSERANP
jgi:hypothetical protein